MPLNGVHAKVSLSLELNRLIYSYPCMPQQLLGALLLKMQKTLKVF